MTSLANTFGIAARNFRTYPEMPDPKALVDYGVRWLAQNRTGTAAQDNAVRIRGIDS